MRRIFVMRQGRKPQPCWRKARISNAVSWQKDKQISSRDSWDINIIRTGHPSAKGWGAFACKLIAKHARAFMINPPESNISVISCIFICSHYTIQLLPRSIAFLRNRLSDYPINSKAHRLRCKNIQKSNAQTVTMHKTPKSVPYHKIFTLA